MDIVVCIKQTPIPADAKFDETTKRLIREGVPVGISSIDRRAVLEALRLRGETGGTVTALTMGPQQARSALIEVLGYGVDRGIHLTDSTFAGSDTLATARVLSSALRKLAPDLVMCGRFTVDSETSQVPSQIAEMLSFPQITSARVIRMTEDPKTLRIERETDEGHEDYLLPLPALISVTELVITGRARPTPEENAIAEKRPILTWGAADIDVYPSEAGFAGSPTRVAELRSAKLERVGRVISGGDAVDAAHQVTEYMLKNGLFDTRDMEAKSTGVRRPVSATPNRSKAVWVIAEMAHGQLRRVTHEMLGKAQILADHSGGEVAAILIGGPDVTAHIDELAAYGADVVYVAAEASLSHYETGAYTEILASAIRGWKPAVVLLPATTNGRDWAPRVAARLGLGLTGDCVDFEIDARGDLAQIKPAFGGNIVAPIYTSTSPAMATVRPGMLEATAPDRSVKPRIVQLDRWHAGSRTTLLQALVEPGLAVTKLDDAHVVVGIGKGVGEAENIPLVAQLADALDGALAATLVVAAAKWVAPQLQVGLTGRSVSPRFYIAIGLSGMANHLFGVRKAQHIIAINNDPEAPIFKAADLGVVGDWAKVVPALTAAVQEAKHQKDKR